jgi:sodium/hydrogen antiporter
VTFVSWMAAAGALLLLVALSSVYLRRLWISTSAVYLAVGIALGPLGFDWVRIPVSSESRWLENLTQVAVIVSLFIGGLKLRLPLSAAAWRSVPRLAGPLMFITIAGVALFAHFVFALPPALALLLGAVLAPTDPVLASAVSVNDAVDRDRMRYGLSGEAGLNDGMAFPFVVLALAWATPDGARDWVRDWFLSRVLWAIPAALISGYLMGKYVGRIAVWLRTRHRDLLAPSDFLALALIALSYVLAEWLSAWGFLAVFAAGVGLRRAELTIVAETPHPDAAPKEREGSSPGHAPAEHFVGAKVSEEAVEQPAVAVGVVVSETLSFGNTAERLLELMLVVIVGIAIASHWDVRALPIALFMFIVLRPLATRLVLMGTPTSSPQRWLMGWFGVRGIGSLYYIAYAIVHHPKLAGLEELADLTLSVVALSIVMHGLSAQPLLALYGRSLERSRGAKKRASAGEEKKGADASRLRDSTV